jgi:CDP-glucose 4,6-dehydratase
MNFGFWKNRRVFLTGHTGFKGGWTALWLTKLGAKVYGYSLAPPTTPNFFLITELRKILTKSTIGDINDLENLKKEINIAKPSIIIHMAAQSIVSESYLKPVETFLTNIIGTTNVLEIARNNDFIEAVINVTSDKCYEVSKKKRAYKETDRLGGRDPYSSSKACSELVTTAYKKSFFSNIGLASVRAGNVIGGGDWAKNRLIPDFFNSLYKKKIMYIRSPNFIRPWQHVFEPISGYLLLAEKLAKNKNKYSDCWNFGPSPKNVKSVSQILNFLKKRHKSLKFQTNDNLNIHETKLLQIDSTKSKSLLGWKNHWDLTTALIKTSEWYEAFQEKKNMMNFSLLQISSYEDRIKKIKK